MKNISHKHFNSIKVQLEQNNSTFVGLMIGHFNSIKVQLELGGNEADTVSKLFQFHKGTIRTTFRFLHFVFRAL